MRIPELLSPEDHCRLFCAWKGGGPCLAEDCPRKPLSEPCPECGWQALGHYSQCSKYTGEKGAAMGLISPEQCDKFIEMLVKEPVLLKLVRENTKPVPWHVAQWRRLRCRVRRLRERLGEIVAGRRFEEDWP